MSSGEHLSTSSSYADQQKGVEDAEKAAKDTADQAKKDAKDFSNQAEKSAKDLSSKGEAKAEQFADKAKSEWQDTSSDAKRNYNKGAEKAQEGLEKAKVQGKKGYAEAKKDAKEGEEWADKNKGNPVVIGNVLVIAALGGLLGTSAYRMQKAGTLTWNVIGAWAGAVGLFAVGDYYVSQYVLSG